MNTKELTRQLAYKIASNQGILQKTAKDLIRKKYLPAQFGEHLKNDPSIWRSSMYNFLVESFHEFQCPHCMITIKAPKEWVKQHIKTHFKPDTKKENEMQIAKINPY